MTHFGRTKHGHNRTFMGTKGKKPKNPEACARCGDALTVWYHITGEWLCPECMREVHYTLFPEEAPDDE